MATKKIVLFLAISMSQIFPLNASNPLSPSTPVVIINTGDIFMPVVVTSTSAGFMAMVVSNDSLQSSFSTDNGATWTNNTPVVENAFYPMWVSGTNAGFMSTWVGPDIGYVTLNAEWSFSTDNGVTWSPAGSILATPSTTIFSPVVVSGTAAGFMAAWNDSNNGDAYATFTNNNGTSWSTPVQLTTSTDLYTAAIVAGTAAGFMVTWAEDTGDAHAVFSSDNGVTWSAPVNISNTGTVASDVWVAGNSFGFMATWGDNNNAGWAVITTDNGVTWSTPVMVTNDVLINGQSRSDLSVAAASSGFVVAWVNESNNAYASFYNIITSTWSTPVAITNDGSVSLGNASEQQNGFSYVGIATQEDPGVLFAWLGNNGNTYSSFSSLPDACPVPTITTLSHLVRCGCATVINATITGGVPPYTIVWSDGLVQTSSSTSISRIVKAFATTSYQIISVTDSAACTGGPSNTVRLTVTPCF